jgi:ABC-type branched-subunit amino acid transport system substrate-binding protein
MTPLAVERKIPLMCVTASLDAIRQPSTFIVQPSTPEQAVPTFNLAKSLAKVPNPKIGVINLALATSSQFGDAMVKLAPANGATVVREQIDTANPDPTAQLTRLVASKPDVVIINAVDLQATKLQQAMKAANLDVPIINTGGGVSLTAILGFKNPRFYVLTAFLYVNPQLPSGTPKAVVDYASDVKAIGGDPNGNFTAAGYIEALLLVAAIKKCADACTPPKVRDNLESLQLASNGLAGAATIGFSPKNHEAIGALGAWSWDDASQAMKLQQANLPLGSA